MRLIPGRTKVDIELFKGISIADLAIGLIAGIIVIFIVTSSLPFKLVLAAIVTLLAAGLLARLDQEPNYLYLLKVLRHFSYKRHYKRIFSDEDLAKIKSEGLETAGLDALFREDGSYQLP